MELGFLPGCVIVAARSAPGGDPRVYRVEGRGVSPCVATPPGTCRWTDPRSPAPRGRAGERRGSALRAAARSPRFRCTAITGSSTAGSPNSGKTTLFNRLTGLRQKVANFPGVTVEQRPASPRRRTAAPSHLIDLPGVYSLVSALGRRAGAHDVSPGKRSDTPKPEAILLVLDSTNLGRHLMLAAPILALGVPTLIVLNMADDLQSAAALVDTSFRPGTRRAGGPGQRASGGRAREGTRISRGRHGEALPRNCPSFGTSRSAGSGRGGERAGAISLAGSAQVDAPAGRGVPPPGGRAARVRGGGGGRLPDDLLGRAPLMDGVRCPSSPPASGMEARCPVGAPLAAHRGRVERRRLGDRVPAADPAALPVHRHPGGLGLPGARGAHRGPHDGRSGCTESRSCRCSRLTRARCRRSWRRARSRASATASPRS